MKLPFVKVQNAWGRPRSRSAPAQLTMVVLDAVIDLPHAGLQSILGLNFGTGSLIDELHRHAEQAGCDRTLVVRSDRDATELSLGNGSGLPIQTMNRSQFVEYLSSTEPADYLLLVDPKAWPAGGFDFEVVVRHSHIYRGAMHAICIGSNPGAFREQIDCDENGCIRRVQRLYALMNWPETADAALLCSLVPARAIADRDFGSLAELRTMLIAAGLFTQDVPVASDVFELDTESGLLALAEKFILSATASAVPAGWSSPSRGVLVGANCRIHPSCRLVPPVVVHPGALIDPDVSIIGPTTIGRGCRIHQGALVSHALLASDTTVGAGTIVNRRVVAGRLVAHREYVGNHKEEATCAPPDIQGGQAWVGSPRRKRFQFAIKRLFDLTVSGVSLLILSPVLVMVAVLIKATSPGPVFFSHRRERMHERGDFPCLKFRTMVSDAHRLQREMYQQNQLDGPQFKMDSDPRITSVGRWLRHTNLDELPQLINVFLGHMSLVGPRPSPFRENQICVPWRRARLSVRPGITGIWQLCRTNRKSGDFHQWIYYDMAYVKHFSLWLDLKILVLTVASRGGCIRVPLNWLVPMDDHDGDELDRAAADEL